MDEMLISLAIILIKCGVLIFILLTGFAYMTWLERKVLGRMQTRYGPNRVGPFGLLQPMADGIKLFFKEDIQPSEIDKPVYLLAPALSATLALIAFAVIPVGPPIQLLGRTIEFYIADVNIAVLYLLAISSLAVYSTVLAGWASNSKYPFLGGIRSSAQMISYELPMGIAIVGVLLLVGSLKLVDIVNAQSRLWFVVLQPLGFILYIVCAIAEVNRAPFDLPEAETELVAGYHTEYSGLKFAMFYIAEYTNIIAVSVIAVTLFLGGYQVPFLPPSPIWFLGKLFIFLFMFIWLRATLPRLRYDRLMNLSWKVLLPLSLANLMVTAILIVVKDLYFS
ncbi:MAG: NADH-quinone oxidoreductase subunit NuoH [Anaerolineae bacterium]